MEPILLVHGYGAEVRTRPILASARRIYGGLPDWLRATYGDDRVFELNLARYLSLDDGIGLDDIARAMDRALREHPAGLAERPFHAIIHSSGALVVRTWLRRFGDARRVRLRNLVYLAGANFGSGWAHLGRGQLARWGRRIFDGADAGVRMLEALELGASETLDLHLHFLGADRRMHDRYGVREFVIAGSQPDDRWLLLPIRYAKEDGSDGVVRAAAANLNAIHFRYEANPDTRGMAGQDVAGLADTYEGYREVAASRPGEDGREHIPFAVTHATSHAGGRTGIVDGRDNRDQVEPLLRRALETRNVRQWRNQVEPFDAVTRESRDRARTGRIGGLFGLKNWSRQAQYDAHAQLIVRLTDQDGRPVPTMDVFLGRPPGDDSLTDVGDLIEHTHRNHATPNVLTFYLRLDQWRDDDADWHDRVADVAGLDLRITSEEPHSPEVRFVPFRHVFDRASLRRLLVPHATTVLDIELWRTSGPNVFRIFPG